MFPRAGHSVVDMQAAYGAVLRPEGRDGHLELEQKDAWRVFFVTLTCKIQKVKWSRERSPSPHRERGVIASEPRKCCAGDAPYAIANSRETWPVQTMSPPFHSVV